MNYIVLDLEWNHSKKEVIKSIPFEIIEIGAVKLNENMRIVSKFSELIKPQIYKEINDVIQEIVNIDKKDLEKESVFEEVIKHFFKWCGNDYMFCTWGSMDLTELQRNMRYYNIKGYIDKPINYCDVQKVFALNYYGKKEAHSLEDAIDYLKLKKDTRFHRALADAVYTAKILKKIDKKYIEKYYSIDCFHNPKTKDQAIYTIYDTYSKYISCEYNTRDELMDDNDIKTVKCFKCGNIAHKKVNWFCSNVKVYACVCECNTHGLILSKVHIKKTDNGKIYAIKTVRPTDENGLKKVMDRQKLIREKRREKRGRKKENK